MEVEPSLLALAAARCDVQPWLAPASGGGAAAGFRLERVARLEGGRPLNVQLPRLGSYACGPGLILAAVTEHPLAAELALRALFQQAALAQGGLLLHASGVAFDGRAVVAFGPSGAGKTTLARLCQAAGGALLSDEVQALLPGGRVLGTPFRSDTDMVGTAAEARLAGLFSLVQAAAELMERLAPATAARLLLSQVYRAEGDGLTSAEVLRRVSGLLASTPVHRFSFRKHEAAALFVRDWLHARHAAL